jgi:alcohol dehydrogenase class IV
MSNPAVPVRPFVGPGRVLAGPGTSSKIGAELELVGVGPGQVLLVADAAVADLGLLAPIVKSLASAGFDALLAPPVAAEPTRQVVETLVSMEDAANVTAVVSVGGGSAIDAAKLAAASLTGDLDLDAGLTPAQPLAPCPPLIAVPTTAGTGAEATAVAMLWGKAGKVMFVHPRLVPRAAVLDSTLLRALPKPVISGAGLDALTHAIESLLSTFRTPLTAAAGLGALGTLATALPSAYENPSEAVMNEMLVGAFQAGLALNASVVLGHSLAYVIAGRARLSHGVSCAMALPYCLAHARTSSESQIEDMAELVLGERDATALVRWFSDLAAAMAIPRSLSDVGIAAADLPQLAEEVVTRYPRPNHPAPIVQGDIEALLEHFLAGDWEAAWETAADPSAAAATERVA